MLVIIRALALPCGLALLFCGQLAAEDVERPASPEFAAPVDESLRELARQLDADAFGERQQATTLLRDKGTQALPILIDAALRGSPEARSRSLQVLQSHLESSEATLQQAAREALEKISAGEGHVARLAQNILNPPPPPSLNELRARQMQLRLPPPAIMRAAMPPAVRRYSITVNENGRVIRISGSDKGIDVEITETDGNGRKVTEKFHGKDAQELKDKHPKAHQVFQDFSQRFGIRPPEAPAEQPAQAEQPPPGPPVPPARQQPADVIERSQQQLRQRIEDMRRQQGQQPDESRTRAIELLERHLQRLEEAKKHFQQEATNPSLPSSSLRSFRSLRSFPPFSAR
jgi:hypothetical protein